MKSFTGLLLAAVVIALQPRVAFAETPPPGQVFIHDAYTQESGCQNGWLQSATINPDATLITLKFNRIGGVFQAPSHPQSAARKWCNAGILLRNIPPGYQFAILTNSFHNLRVWMADGARGTLKTRTTPFGQFISGQWEAAEVRQEFVGPLPDHYWTGSLSVDPNKLSWSWCRGGEPQENWITHNWFLDVSGNNTVSSGINMGLEQEFVLVWRRCQP